METSSLNVEPVMTNISHGSCESATEEQLRWGTLEVEGGPHTVMIQIWAAV